MDLTNLQMNITSKIEDLKAERMEQIIIREHAHNRIKELRLQIKKLQTLSKKAEEVLGEKVEENGQGELTGVEKGN